LHKSIGITIRLAALLWLVWRLTHRPPALHDTVTRTEQAAASGAHWLLYFLLFGLPLSGWALVSVSPLGIPTVLYGMVPWPHLPGFGDVIDKVAAGKTIGSIHAWGAYGFSGIVILHAAAAIRHHFVLRDDVLTRMMPRRRRLPTNTSTEFSA
jgi:cytochrome b561